MWDSDVSPFDWYFRLILWSLRATFSVSPQMRCAAQATRDHALEQAESLGKSKEWLPGIWSHHDHTDQLCPLSPAMFEC